MIQWEYQTLEYDMEAMTHTELDKNLDDEGDKGWEVACTLHPTGKTAWLLMKRQKVQNGSLRGFQAMI